MIGMLRSLRRFQSRHYSTFIRNDPKWNYLRSNEELKKRVGDFISLPLLPIKSMPKGFQPANLTEFLLTRQRLQILDEVIEAVDKGKLASPSDNGLCLSGPHGVGKSGLNYLLASVAYVRGWFLQYIPLCGEWTAEPSDNEMAQFYIDNFKDLNSDLLESVKHDNLKDKTLRDVFELSIPPVSKQAKIHYFLSKTTEKPFLLLLDEHNELWKPRFYKLNEWEKKEIIPAKLQYFYSFAKWTTLTGPRMFLVFSGSAHSQFENNLPAGEDRKLRYIYPFDKDEAFKMMTKLGISKFGVSCDTVYDEITGGVPRQIVSLSSAKGIEDWRDYQVDRYFISATSTLRESSKEDQQRIISYLGKLFENQRISKPPSGLYDKGLFYVREGSGFPINPMARSALFWLWVMNKKREVIGGGKTGSETGAVFEREAQRGFIRGLAQIELEPYYLNNDTKPTTLRIARIEQVVSFQSESDIPQSPKFISSLLKPISETFKAIDFILKDVMNKQIIFVQTTILFPHEHDNKSAKIETLFKEGRMARILDSIFSVKGATATIEDGHFIFVLPETVSDWQVKILYLTSQQDEDVKRKHWKWKDLLVAGRETLTPLNLVFDEVEKKR
eukprot:TRINITY_DN2622_c0_g1_i4.p1 TRINITY_DN2622_c0_g1~~TRINITY_DN2622_c0_g1_i4.p1  ORF type:complete len:613 (-),score=78.21 TRINITY_DN2622_c0_g1_i4:89-1927(-)